MRDALLVTVTQGRRLWCWLATPSQKGAGIMSAGCIGMLLGVGFVFPGWWWFYGLGIPLFFTRAQRAVTGKKAVWTGWWIGTISSAWSLVWFWSVLPIDWIPVGSIFVQAIVVVGYWMTASLWLGAGGALVAWAWWLLSKRYPGSWWWAMPTLWVMGELCGSLVFAVATWQSDIAITPHFSFGYIGYLLAQHEWLFHFAAVAGVYGLSWVAVFLSCVLFYSLPRAGWRWVFGAIAMLWVLQFMPVPVSQTPADISVAVVETQFTGPYRREMSIEATIEEAVDIAETAGAEYVILPEDMRYITNQLDSLLLPITLRQQLGTSSVTIVDSGRIDTAHGAVLRGVVYDNASADRWVADKQYLVPQGEYIPAAYAWVLGRVGYSPVLREISSDINYVPGPQATQRFLGRTPGILFCFESVTPWGVRRVLSMREQTPVFVAHPISHAWFHSPTILWHQLDTMLRVQARWNEVPIVSAGNLAPSAVYHQDGGVERVPNNTLPVNDRVQVKLFTL